MPIRANGKIIGNAQLSLSTLVICRTSQYIANEMYGMIVENMSFEPKFIIRHIQEKYKYTISYSKAWSAKQKVLEMRFGTFGCI
jgi:hypothetical protein